MPKPEPVFLEIKPMRIEQAAQFEAKPREITADQATELKEMFKKALDKATQEPEPNQEMVDYLVNGIKELEAQENAGDRDRQ